MFVVAVSFCVMVAVKYGVRVAGMGCGVWVWPCGMPACVVAELWGKKMGMAVWVADMSVGKAWEKKIIF